MNTRILLIFSFATIFIFLNSTALAATGPTIRVYPGGDTPGTYALDPGTVGSSYSTTFTAKTTPYISAILMKVPWDYKADKMLAKGSAEAIDATSPSPDTTDYEEDGLDDLIAVGKCSDCGTTAEEREKIIGIVTASNPIIVFVDIEPNAVEDVSDYSVKITIEGSAAAPQTIPLSGPNCDSSGTKYVCHTTFTSGLQRGKKIDAKAEIFKSGTSVSDMKSDYFVVAKYNVFTFSSSGSNGWQTGQYSSFSDISDLNKEIKYSGKPVYISWLWSVVGSCSMIVNRYSTFSLSSSEFDSSIDTIVVYDRNLLDFLLYGTGLGSRNVGGLTGCPSAPIFHPFGTPNKYFITMNTGTSFVQNEYVLAHEMGHRFSNYQEEYDWKTWRIQSTYGTSNAKNEFGIKDFPICCKKYVCCEGFTLSYLSPVLVTRQWKENYRCSLGYGFTFRVVSDSLCNPSTRPNDRDFARDSSGNIITPDNCGTPTSCTGTPYTDNDGLLPQTVTDNEMWSTFSVMGSPNYAGTRVYPEPSVCPLKHCA